MRKQEVVLLFSCDAWKSYDSMDLVGVFEDGLKLRESIFKAYSENRAEWMGVAVSDLNSNQDPAELKESLEQVREAIFEADLVWLDTHLTYLYLQSEWVIGDTDEE